VLTERSSVETLVTSSGDVANCNQLNPPESPFLSRKEEKLLKKHGLKIRIATKTQPFV